jgi:Na+-driven multidrug efflux pump
VISELVGLVVVIGFFVRHKETLPIKLKWPKGKINWQLTAMTIQVGIAPGAMQAANSVVIVMLNSVLLKYGGNTGVAALTIVSSIQGLAFLPVVGYCQGQQPIIGFNYGAKAWQRVRATVRYAVKMCVIFGMGALAICIFATGPLVKLFSSDGDLVEMATFGVRVAMMMAILVSVQVLMANYFQYTGKAKQATILSLLRQMIVLLPLIYILPRFFGLKGVWAAWPMADVISTLITGVVFVKDYRRLPKRDEVTEGAAELDKLAAKVEAMGEGPETELMEDSLGV